MHFQPAYGCPTGTQLLPSFKTCSSSFIPNPNLSIQKTGSHSIELPHLKLSSIQLPFSSQETKIYNSVKNLKFRSDCIFSLKFFSGFSISCWFWLTSYYMILCLYAPTSLSPKLGNVPVPIQTCFTSAIYLLTLDLLGQHPNTPFTVGRRWEGALVSLNTSTFLGCHSLHLRHDIK